MPKRIMSDMTGPEFRALREGIGGTITAFAIRIGVTRRAVYDYQGGSPIPQTVAELVRMIAAKAA